MTTRENHGCIEEIYGVKVPPSLIYPINAIEAPNLRICQSVRPRSHFLSDNGAAKLIYLAPNARLSD
jgi:transposase-like protein